MKSIEVLAQFYKGKVNIMSFALNKKVYKVSTTGTLRYQGTRKDLTYYKVEAEKKSHVLAFNPQNKNWLYIKTL